MTDNNEKKHSPTPWRQDKAFYCEIEDANGDHIFTSSSQYNPKLGDEQCRANAEFILEAVNSHDKLRDDYDQMNGIAADLQRSRAKIIEDNDRLREALAGLLAWCSAHAGAWVPDDVAIWHERDRAMQKARAALGEEAGNADRNETLAEIVAWIRRQAEQMDLGTACAWSPVVVRELANLIEAAAKRERQTVTNCNGLGNSAKLREAILSMIRQENPFLREDEIDRDAICGRCLDGKIMFKDCKHDGSCWVDKVWAALAAPPRNCDVGTAEEQDRRFREFCRSRRYQSCKGCPIYDSPVEACAITWGQLPYEATPAGGDHADA